MAELVAAVDVGTGSARAGVFDAHGQHAGPRRASDRASRTRQRAGPNRTGTTSGAPLARRSAPPARRPARSPKRSAASGSTPPARWCCATAAAKPLAASGDGQARWDTLLWFDHRAQAEAAECTAIGPRGRGERRRRDVARDADTETDVGEAASSGNLGPPRPRLRSRRLPHLEGDGFERALDSARSPANGAISATLRPAGGRISSRRSGLADLRARAALPDVATAVGADIGPLTTAAAAMLGLTPATRVAAGLIDAHAGVLGVLGGLPAAERDRQAALVAGTSNCLMTISAAPLTAPGLWGPARDAAPAGALGDGGRPVRGRRAARPRLPDRRRRSGRRPPRPHRGADRRASRRRRLGPRRGPARPARPARQPLAARGSFGALERSAGCRSTPRSTAWSGSTGAPRSASRSACAMSPTRCAPPARRSLGCTPPAAMCATRCSRALRHRRRSPGRGARRPGRRAARRCDGRRRCLRSPPWTCRRGTRDAIARPRIPPDPTGAARLERDGRVLAEMRRQRAALRTLV